MTPYKPLLVGWFILSSTLVTAAPKSKLGKHPQVAKTTAAAQARHQGQKNFRKPSSVSAEPSEELSVDSVFYRAQKMAGELTEEVGYLLKSTGPWLKEIEGMIRGEETGIAEVAALPPKKGARPIAAATVPAPNTKPVGGKKLPKRQLSQMSANPNSILETVKAVSQETWEKVHVLVADLMAQAKSMAD